MVGCMITLLVVCCISMVSSWFSVMSCRFHAQLKPVQIYTFLKDPRPFTSSNFRVQSVGSVRGSLELLRIRVRKQTRLQLQTRLQFVHLSVHCLLHDQLNS